jgi:ribonucleotide reductase alpha subunit
VVSIHHKNTLSTFSDKIELLYFQGNVPIEQRINLIDKRFYKFVHLNEAKINAMIDYKKDYSYDYFGFKTLEKGYLLSIGGTIIERPQDMIMRAAIQMHMRKMWLISELPILILKRFILHIKTLVINIILPQHQFFLIPDPHMPILRHVFSSVQKIA